MLIVEGYDEKESFRGLDPVIRLGKKDYVGIENFKKGFTETIGDNKRIHLIEVTTFDSKYQEYIVGEVEELTQEEIAQEEFDIVKIIEGIQKDIISMSSDMEIMKTKIRYLQNSVTALSVIVQALQPKTE